MICPSYVSPQISRGISRHGNGATGENINPLKYREISVRTRRPIASRGSGPKPTLSPSLYRTFAPLSLSTRRSRRAEHHEIGEPERERPSPFFLVTIICRYQITVAPRRLGPVGFANTTINAGEIKFYCRIISDWEFVAIEFRNDRSVLHGKRIVRGTADTGVEWG